MKESSDIRKFVESLFENGRELSTKEAIVQVRTQRPELQCADSQITNAIYNMKRTGILDKMENGKYKKNICYDTVEEHSNGAIECKKDDESIKKLTLKEYIRKIEKICAETERITSTPGIFGKIENDGRACELFRINSLNEVIWAEIKNYKKYC